MPERYGRVEDSFVERTIIVTRCELSHETRGERGAH
jgi:hypothetical protein